MTASPERQALSTCVHTCAQVGFVCCVYGMLPQGGYCASAEHLCCALVDQSESSNLLGIVETERPKKQTNGYLLEGLDLSYLPTSGNFGISGCHP